jgi:hypothetical protein
MESLLWFVPVSWEEVEGKALPKKNLNGDQADIISRHTSIVIDLKHFISGFQNIHDVQSWLNTFRNRRNCENLVCTNVVNLPG